MIVKRAWLKLIKISKLQYNSWAHHTINHCAILQFKGNINMWYLDYCHSRVLSLLLVRMDRFDSINLIWSFQKNSTRLMQRTDMEHSFRPVIIHARDTCRYFWPKIRPNPKKPDLKPKNRSETSIREALVNLTWHQARAASNKPWPDSNLIWLEVWTCLTLPLFGPNRSFFIVVVSF